MRVAIGAGGKWAGEMRIKTKAILLLNRIHSTRILVYLLCIPLLLIGLAGSMAACSKPGDGAAHLTVLHTNDTHAHLDDVARRALLAERIRNEVGDDNVLLLDAGDVFSGTAYFTLYQGQADLWFMNYMQYSAMSLGNHEFDKGPTALAKFVDSAEFPVLSANLDFSRESELAGKVVPWVAITKGRDRYGLFGLTTEDTEEISSPGPNIDINYHKDAARDAVLELESMGIDKIIAITHIGWDNDLELAREVEGIDIIVGGHSHTLPDAYPTVVVEDDTPTLVTQAGDFGGHLGRLNVSFDKAGIVMGWEGSELISVGDTVQEDAACASKLAGYRGRIDELMKEEIGSTLVDLDGERNNVRTQETNLGDLIADAMLDKAGAAGATVAVLNSGSIRASIPAGRISMGQVINTLPFDNYLVVLDLTGEQVVAALENGVSKAESVEGRFPQVGGLRFTWDPAALAGKRIITVEVGSPGNYQPIDISAKYRVVTNDYIYQGGEGYDVFQEGSNVIIVGFILHEVVAEFIHDNSPIGSQIEGRIVQRANP